MQACGRLVARKGEQDVDRDIAAVIEIDGGDMASVMGDLDDPAIDDRYVAARQVGPDVGRNVVTIGEDRQPVGPIVKQPDRILRPRAGPDVAPMLAGDFNSVAIGAGHDRRAPAFGKARNIRHLIGDAIAQDQAARPKAFAIASEDGEIVDGAGDAVGPGIDQPDRGIARQLLPRLCQDFQRRLVIVAEQAMRVASEAVARQAGIENGDLAAGTAELQGAGETGKAAADDDDVIHGEKLRVVDGGGWARPGAEYRPAIRARDGHEQGFGIDEKVAHHCFGRPDNPHSISPGGPGKLDLEDRLKSTRWLARSRSDRADLRSVRTWWLSLERPLSSRDLDRRGVRIAAISCGTHDPR